MDQHLCDMNNLYIRTIDLKSELIKAVQEEGQEILKNIHYDVGQSGSDPYDVGLTDGVEFLIEAIRSRSK